MTIASGQLAPEFKLLNQDGQPVALGDYKDKQSVLVYFYPRASTPGCTVQAQGIRDHLTELAALNTVVLAISPDPVAKIKKFVDKYSLNFNLLSDPDHQIAEAYGVWGLKKFMGKESMGIIRTSFIIDMNGMIVDTLPKFTTKNHHAVLLDFLNNHLD